MNGVVTAISNQNGKCLDFDVLSKRCHGCAMWQKRKNTSAYLDWELNHECENNHHGSSGSMEASGALNMFGIQFDVY